jgi:RNA polymerase sigma-70 factor, ECF subfamily
MRETMSETTGESTQVLRRRIDEIYRTEERRIFATLVRLLGDFDLAEEALQEAFVAAVTQWPQSGIPANPRAWLVSAGRFKGIDSLRRRARFDASLPELAEQIEERQEQAEALEGALEEASLEDDRLRLIFTCCHPALAADARVALTLREVCGLTTEEIARAFLVTPTTLAQRIVRAKNKIRDARIPYEVPEPEQLPERLETVLQVIYLVYNEGYSATTGATVTRPAISGEAIRLGRLLAELLPGLNLRPSMAGANEVIGLLALMLLHESRREARTSPQGEIILLEDQDRSLWRREQIAEATALVERAFAAGPVGPYTLQAAIAALHANAPDFAATDWPQIVALYDLLYQVIPTPVVELNRAVALSMRDGPEAGLRLIDAILASGELAEYHLLHATRADLSRRLGRKAEARAAFQRALALAQQEPERVYLERRLRELDE